ncbi:hypothetical protein HW555_007497 [Spodoptera exigua]|uniref:Uncharacterized protein n=1 Tax=Spodoptera exigua TaxID=7107 RepID=A0A835GGA0_SPOEX|nr:hypothetical protein HW555_007497 [Spodoptera exigua]
MKFRAPGHHGNLSIHRIPIKFKHLVVSEFTSPLSKTTLRKTIMLRLNQSEFSPGFPSDMTIIEINRNGKITVWSSIPCVSINQICQTFMLYAGSDI